jgi:hypothetical protein
VRERSRMSLGRIGRTKLILCARCRRSASARVVRRGRLASFVGANCPNIVSRCCRDVCEGGIGEALRWEERLPAGAVPMQHERGAVALPVGVGW